MSIREGEMAKHSRRPWIVRSFEGQSTRLAVYDADGHWVADARAYSGHGPKLEVQEANARLIAAAPELYREVQAWRMLARGEIPERMTAEQYAFSQERDWGEELAEWNDRMKIGKDSGLIGELVDLAKEAWTERRVIT